MWSPHTWYIYIIIQQLRAFGMPWSPSFLLGLPPRNNFWKELQATMKHDPFDAMYESTSLGFTYSVGPSSVVWTELGLAPPFPPMRVLEVQSSRALSFMCGVAYCGTEGRMTIAKQLRRTPNCHPSIHPPTHPRSHPSIHGSLKIEDRVVERDGGRRRPARAVRVRSRVAGVGGCRAARDPSVRRSVGPSVALSSLPFVAWPGCLECFACLAMPLFHLET
jgi:hypothetical protein